MNRYVVFDLETGGLEMRHPIIQIGAVAVQWPGWNVLEEFEVKLNFDEIQCEPGVLGEKNSYREGAWKREAVDKPVALKKFASFLSRHSDKEKISKWGRPYYVAHLIAKNQSFDADRIIQAFKAHNIFMPGSFLMLCAQQLAQWYFFQLPEQPKSFKLEDLCEHFGIDFSGAHDALADCLLTVELLKRMAPRASDARPDANSSGVAR